MININNNAINDALHKEKQLRNLLINHTPILIAYSGGVDSSYLAYIANKELGHNMLAVLALSPSLAASEKKRALSFLQEHHIPYRIVETSEILDARYTKNDKNRCFYCKTALFQACQQVANELHWHHIAYGFNLDDAGDFRPGQKAAEQQQILRPLYDSGMTKDDIRICSENHGLADFDRPAQPCLSSRLLYGTEVTTLNLQIVETMEMTLHELGFKHCRARYDGTTVRLEVPVSELANIILDKNREAILNTVKSLGVKFITLDLEGLQSGKLNRLIQESHYA
jgi:uncharacterized protein